MYDNITKPHHYGWHPSGVEAKEVTDDLPRWLGDAITYIWRRNHKGQPITDRLKAIERLNEATPERFRALQAVLTGRMIKTMDKIVVGPDNVLCDAITLVQEAKLGASYYRIWRTYLDQLKTDLQAELDELTTNETTRTPTIYEEQ